jgi:broad specificity phosphatase PhoE
LTADVVLIRHGETDWSRSGRHTGRTDIPLTDAGRAEASSLGERLRGRTFGLTLTSPLSRATETASLAGLDPEIEPDLVEWDYGEYEGSTTAQIREKRPGWLLWRDGCPRGEDAVAVGRRADRVIDRVLHASEDRGRRDVALVAHGHVLRSLAARWCELGPEAGARLLLDTGTLSVLGWEREVRVIRVWNEGLAEVPVR